MLSICFIRRSTTRRRRRGGRRSRLDETGRSLVRAAMQQLQMSARAFHRILKLARTIADPSAGSGRAWRGANGLRRRIPRLRSGQAGRRRSSTGRGGRCEGAGGGGDRTVNRHTPPAPHCLRAWSRPAGTASDQSGPGARPNGKKNQRGLSGAIWLNHKLVMAWVAQVQETFNAVHRQMGAVTEALRHINGKA